MDVANFRLIRLARELRGLSQTAAAAQAGIPQAVLSRIEGDIRPASHDELRALAATLDFPARFFSESDAPAAAPLFRKRAIRSVRVNRLIQARINVAVLAARRILDAGIEIAAPLALPEAGEIPPDDPMLAAQSLRQAWRLPSGRVDSMTATIEAAGGIVLHVDFGTEDASAAFISMLGDSRLWFLVNTRETAGDRVRLSLAHELGHAVMHRYLPVHDESRLEPEAYCFATAFTLPPNDFDVVVDGNLKLSRARDLKRAYWISIQAIIRAARDRHLISADRYTSLYKQISARGWRRIEPDPVPVEQPTIWPSALTTHREVHDYDDEELAKIARVSPEVLASLFPHDFAPKLRVLEGGLTPRPSRARNALRAL
jgi:Zn-dependent peptidase ImmA (M78 family)/transcriptional regulator with XRE-family HTH domain